MFAPAKRPRALLHISAGFAALAAIGAICFMMSAPEAKRNARVITLVRSVCEHSGVNHVALERLVRMNRDAAVNQDHAVQTTIAYCLESSK
ncbi:hypothetical protein SAMN05444161_8624 [Rhizobiales bacterium GAS191]|nr:hypothetical protein SAMN05444161_8624 [Rhizobiales bacterium GAS191]